MVCKAPGSAALSALALPSPPPHAERDGRRARAYKAIIATTAIDTFLNQVSRRRTAASHVGPSLQAMSDSDTIAKVVNAQKKGG